MPKSGGIYRYTDSGGAEHLVGSLREVPAALRSQAVAVGGSVTVERAPGALQSLGNEAQQRGWEAQAAALAGVRRGEQALHGLGWVGTLHVPSALIGGGGALLLLLVGSMVRRRPGRVLRLVATVALGCLMAGGYTGWARWASGTGSGLATPQTLIEDALRARAAVQDHYGREQQAVERLEK